MHYSHGTITGPYARVKYDFTVASRAHISSSGSTYKETDLQVLFSYTNSNTFASSRNVRSIVSSFVVGNSCFFSICHLLKKKKSNTALFASLKLKTGPKENVPWKSFTDLFL